jgi:hypothetical protein
MRDNIFVSGAGSDTEHMIHLVKNQARAHHQIGDWRLDVRSSGAGLPLKAYLFPPDLLEPEIFTINDSPDDARTQIWARMEEICKAYRRRNGLKNIDDCEIGDGGPL